MRTMVLAIRLRSSRTSANSIERIASSVVATVSFFLRRNEFGSITLRNQENEMYSCAGPHRCFTTASEEDNFVKMDAQRPESVGVPGLSHR